jgi:hypothetical protein
MGAAAAVTVAVVGGGVTGSVAVTHLARLLPAGSTIVCFDQGRALGGRTSMRRIRASDQLRMPPANQVDNAEEQEECFAWDHGCQFFRADTAEFRSEILGEWLDKQLAVEWRGKFGNVDGNLATPGAGHDFFGIPGKTPVYHGLGGMHTIANGLLLAAAAHEKGDVSVEVKVGARVAKVEKIESDVDQGKWRLMGTSGEAAFHDSKESVAQQAQHTACSPLAFDALLVTDVSASFEGWHRASAGLPACAQEVMARVRERVRVPLFTALVAFKAKIPEIDLDAITFKVRTSLDLPSSWRLIACMHACMCVCMNVYMYVCIYL